MPPQVPVLPAALAALAAALVGLALVAHLAGGVARGTRPAPADPVHLLQGGAGPVPAQLSGRLLADPWFPPDAAGKAALPAGSPGAGPCRVLLETATGRSELVLQSCPPLRQGWRVRATGRLSRPRPAPHPLLAGAAERLARQGAWTRLAVERLEVLERPATPVVDLRRRIAERFLAAAGAERGGLLAALVLGSAVVPLPAELRESFRVAGLSHALAASGFHLTVLLGAVLALARPFGRAARLALACGAIALFLLLAGPQPSVVRAVIMGSLALLAREWGGRARPLALLALTAAAMLLVRPGWITDVGFQLSLAATAGLLLTATPLQGWLLRHWPWPSGGGRSWLAEALAVPLAATLWTLPLQLLHFGALPLYAVPANVAAAPLLTPLTLGAMALALVAVLVPPLLGPLLVPVDLLGRALLQLAHGFAALPLAQWQTGRPQPLLVLLLTLALVPWLLAGVPRLWRRLGLGLFALVVALHLALLGGDQLLLVHEGSSDLLLARHRGRGALLSRRADPPSCRRAAQLARGLGIQAYDWLLLLDPVAPAEPACWRELSAVVVSEGADGAPLGAGQSVASPGLAAEALAMDSQALLLRYGPFRWLLLPDRQAHHSWRSVQRPVAGGVWLGFIPRGQERQALLARRPGPVWLSGSAPDAPPLPAGWRASGASGFLHSQG